MFWEKFSKIFWKICGILCLCWFPKRESVTYTVIKKRERTVMQPMNIGYLLVSTRTADGLLLVPYADVRVYDSEGDLIFEGQTNRDGYTSEIAVATPAASASLTPGADKPYAEVSIFVEKEGFYGSQYIGVPVFDNVLSVQQTSLQAIPDVLPIPPYFDSVVNESGASRI